MPSSSCRFIALLSLVSLGGAYSCGEHAGLQCDVHAACNVMHGGFCVCNSGYTGSGVSCHSLGPVERSAPVAPALGPVRTPFDHFAKQTAPAGEIVSGGRLIRRGLKYLAAAGYKSVVSVVPFVTDAVYKGVPGDWLSSKDQVAQCEATGMNATVFDFGGESGMWTKEAALKIHETLASFPKPLYIHCHVGYSAALFAQLHHVLVGDAKASSFYQDTLSVGWDFQSDTKAIQVVADVTNTALAPLQPVTIELDLNGNQTGYMTYYWLHRLGHQDGFYNIGQVLSTQVGAISGVGVKSVISFRTDGEGTVRLPSEPASGPVENWEFADAEGNWNASAEQAAFEAAGVRWFNAPVGGTQAFTVAQLDSYMPIFKAAAAVGPTLVHCKTGYRSSIYTLAYRGRSEGRCAKWALDQAQQVGFDLSSRDSDAKARKFLADVLAC